MLRLSIRSPEVSLVIDPINCRSPAYLDKTGKVSGKAVKSNDCCKIQHHREFDYPFHLEEPITGNDRP
jgi:hypothetical protein